MLEQVEAPRPLTNEEIAAKLRELALYYEMERVPFKPQALEKAAWSILALDRPVASIHAEGGDKALRTIPGVGEGVARRVAEILATGHLAELEQKEKTTPVDLEELTSIEGLGALRAKALYDAIRVNTLAELESACRAGKVRKIRGFGEKTETKLLRAIALRRESGGRRPLAKVLPLALDLEARLKKLPGVERAAVAGSIRRRKETIGDADFLIAATDPTAVMDYFASMPEVEEVYAKGPTKTLVRLKNGMDADLRVVPPESWGAALMYFTGSKVHNVALRRIAMEKKLKLNEYGLFRGSKAIAAKEEEDVYRALGMRWIPPEKRENTGEIELALERHEVAT